MTMFDYMDERTGVWTDVHHGPAEVTFILRPQHARGRWVGLAMVIGVIVLTFLGSVNALSPIGMVVLACGLLLIALPSLRKLLPPLNEPLLVVRDATDAEPDPPSNNTLNAADIRAVHIRENTGRDPANDLPLWQVYLETRDAPAARPVYQQLKTEHGRLLATETARQLAHRWSVPLIEH